MWYLLSFGTLGLYLWLFAAHRVNLDALLVPVGIFFLMAVFKSAAKEHERDMQRYRDDLESGKKRR